MKYLTFEENEESRLYLKIDEMLQLIKNKLDPNPLPERWLDSAGTCRVLCICKRKLQQIRDEKQLNFSKIQGKTYFRAEDIQKYLLDHYNGEVKGRKK